MPDLLHSIKISDADYEKAAMQWKSDFLLMPLFSCMDALKYMQGMPGVTVPTKLPSVEGAGQFAPYRRDRKSASETKIDYREITSYLGNVREDFEPLEIVQTLLGRGTATLGDAQMQAPTARLVIAEVMRSLGHHLHNALFTAKRNASGDTTADLFDGWGTILDKEMADGNISEAKGNLITLTETIDGTNAVDIAKEIERSCNPHLRRLQKLLFCDPAFADNYNDAYLVTHNAVPYNKKYEQPIIEGVFQQDYNRAARLPRGNGQVHPHSRLEHALRIRQHERPHTPRGETVGAVGNDHRRRNVLRHAVPKHRPAFPQSSQTQIRMTQWQTRHHPA